MPLMTCPTCGQTYNPKYMRYCARCGEALPDERGKRPKPGPMDGMGSRGGAEGRKPVPSAPTETEAEQAPPDHDWQPTHAVEDIVLEYRTRLNEAPEDHSARYALALAYMLVKRWDVAMEELKQVVAGMPDFADAWYNLAVCQARLGKLDVARRSVRSALEIAPDDRRYAALAEKLEAASER